MEPPRPDRLTETSGDAIRESIRIGVAGWSYPDWKGIVYDRERGSDALRLVASLFDLVEINSTFYRIPPARYAESWAATVADRPRFVFTAKVPGEMTHDRATKEERIREAGRELLEGLAPVIDAGRLDVLVAQFPPSFRDGAVARRRIESIVEALRPVHVVVEIRDTSFLQAAPGTAPDRDPGAKGFFDFLKDLGAGFVNVDLPAGRQTVPPTTVNTSAVGYVRFHGRNRKAWFSREAGRDAKYNYDYDRDELQSWAPRILEIASRTQHMHVVTNNHFRGQAPANALDLLEILGLSGPAEIPATLLAAFPRLRSSRSPAPRGSGQ